MVVGAMVEARVRQSGYWWLLLLELHQKDSPAIDMFDLIKFDSINQCSINQCSIKKFD